MLSRRCVNMTDAEGNEKVKDGTDDETVPSGWKL